MDFELAAVYRDRLRALTYIQGSQAIHAEGLGDADMFALACKGGTMCIQAFFIRGGQNWGHRSFFPAHTADVPEEEVLASFLVQFYEEVPPPRLILVDRDAAGGRAARRGAVASAPGARWRSSVPQRGDQAQADRAGEAQRRGGARPAAGRDHDPGANPARARRTVRAGRAAAADRGLRQQPYHGHQCGRRDDRRRARGLPQERSIASSTSSGRRPRPATISR